jgi:N-methylhydantoinase A
LKRIAVDIGGTFIDIICIDEDTMQISVGKVRVVPDNLGQGVLQAIEKIKVNIPAISIFIHGTTTGLNALLQNKGSKVGLITTDGFADILEMARGNRKELSWYRDI